MATSQKKIDANRLNAQKSTGPKTEEGKAASAQNHLKHGLRSQNVIINSTHLKEDPVEYNNLLSSLCEELKPQSAFQELLICKIANSLWRSRRLISAETAEINEQLDDINPKSLYVPGHGFFRLHDDSDSDSDTDDSDDDDTNDADDTKISLETYSRALENRVSSKSIPDGHSILRFARYEMRLDRQLTGAYKLLRLLQLEQKADSLLNHNNEIKK